MIDDGMLMEGDVWWPGHGGTAGQLLCFDVGNSAKPNLASSVNLSVEENQDGKKEYVNRWNFSEAVLNDNGLVYLSSQHTDYIEIEPDEENQGSDGDEEGDGDETKPDPDEPIDKPLPEPEPWPRGYWITRVHRLPPLGGGGGCGGGIRIRDIIKWKYIPGRVS